MKKKLPQKNSNSTLNIKALKEIEKQTGEKIQKGLKKPTASTGKSMNDLKGGAKFMAQLSNIGGGSQATGGKGIADGFNTIVQNQKAKTILQTISQKSLKDTASPLISDKKKGKRKKK